MKPLIDFESRIQSIARELLGERTAAAFRLLEAMSLPLRRLAAAGASLGGVGMCYEAHRYRATFHLTGVVPGQEETSHFSEPPPSWLYARARDAVIAAGSAGCAFITQVLNTTDVRNVHHFRRAHAARSERPVLTVCNHQSCLDDPCLLPLLLADSGVVLDGASMRWGIGKEALCFSSDLASAFFSAAKILPVRRGGGLEQPGLAVLARKATPGQWLHIYPEGRVWQCHPLGGGVAQWDGTPYNHKKAIAGHRPYLRWVRVLPAPCAAAPPVCCCPGCMLCPDYACRRAAALARIGPSVSRPLHARLARRMRCAHSRSLLRFLLRSLLRPFAGAGRRQGCGRGPSIARHRPVLPHGAGRRATAGPRLR